MNGFIFFHDDTSTFGDFEVGVCCTDVNKFVEETNVPTEIASDIRESIQAIEDGSNFAYNAKGAYSYIISEKSIDELIEELFNINQQSSYGEICVEFVDIRTLIKYQNQMIYSFSN